MIADGDDVSTSATSNVTPPRAQAMTSGLMTSEWVAEDDVGVKTLVGDREIDAPEDVRAHPRTQTDAAGDAHVAEQIGAVVDLTDGQERVDAPVGCDAVDVQLHDADALLDLDFPRAHRDEAVVGVPAQQELAAQRRAVIERNVAAAELLRPIQARGQLQS